MAYRNILIFNFQKSSGKSIRVLLPIENSRNRDGCRLLMLVEISTIAIVNHGATNLAHGGDRRAQLNHDLGRVWGQIQLRTLKAARRQFAGSLETPGH